MGLPVMIISALILNTALMCEGLLYVPTIVNACANEAGESFRLNVEWKFAGDVDLTNIEGFTITYASLGGGSLILYQYRPSFFNSNSGIETDGKTYVRNIPFNIVSDETMIAVYITSNDTIHPQSQLYTVEQCRRQDTTTTATTSTTTTATTTTTGEQTTSTPTIIPSTSSAQSVVATTTINEAPETTTTTTPLLTPAGLVYVPTIVNACVYQNDDGSRRLNAQWEFEQDVDLSRIEGFTITYGNTGGGNLILYQYRSKHFNSSSGIETDGKTYVTNIPFNVDRDEATIAIYITTNSIVHPQSQSFTVERRCSNQDTTTTTKAIEPTTSTSIITPSTSLAQSTIATTTQKASETTTTSPSVMDTATRSSTKVSTSSALPTTTASSVNPTSVPTGIELYVPTITSACISRVNGTHRLNIQWKFPENADLSEIDQFDVVYRSTNINATPTNLYHYPDNGNTFVNTDGKTFAKNILLPDVITSTTIQVQVATVANRAVNPPSDQFTTTECTTVVPNPTATTSTATSDAGVVESVLVTKLPIPSTESLSTASPTPNSGPTDQSNVSSSNDSDEFPIIVVVIAVAIICLVLLVVMIVLLVFIVRLKYKSGKNKDSESEAESVKPLQNGSLLFRQADKVNYLKTPSQIIDSEYNSAQKQAENPENASNQSQRYSEAHKYDVPANNKAAKNDYDHIDFQYEQADHPFQQSYTNGGLNATYYEESLQPKYNVLVHSSSMDKLGKDCPNPPSITTDHYNKLHDNTSANTNQAHLKNGEVYYSVPVNIPSDGNSTSLANNANINAEPHDYDRLSERP